jgi:hypothetical protein
VGDVKDEAPEEVVPSAEESWERHVRILDLLKQIRVARERRPVDRTR